MLFAFLALLLACFPTAWADDRTQGGGRHCRHPQSFPEEGIGWWVGARYPCHECVSAYGGNASGFAVGRGPAPGDSWRYRPSCTSSCQVGSMSTRRRRHSLPNRRIRPIALEVPEADAEEEGAADSEEEEDGKSAAACKGGLLHHARRLGVHRCGSGDDSIDCGFNLPPRPPLCLSSVRPGGHTARSAAAGEDGCTSCDALVPSGGDDGDATGFWYDVATTRATRPSRCCGILMDLHALSFAVDFSLRSGNASGRQRPGVSDEAGCSADHRASLLTGPKRGFIPMRRREEMKAQEGNEQEEEETHMYSASYVVFKVKEYMRSPDGYAKDWKAANLAGEGGGGGRCGTRRRLMLCGNAHSPAAKAGRWLARSGRRGGFALAPRLCDHADTSGANHATVGRGGWRGGRCGVRCCTRLCGNAYLAWSNVEANGGASWSWRCRSCFSVKLSANVYTGGTEGAWSGWTEGLKREEDGDRGREMDPGIVGEGAGGEAGARRGRRNLESQHNSRHQRMRTLTKYTQSHGSRHAVTFGTGCRHMTRRQLHIIALAPCLRFHPTTVDGNGGPAAKGRQPNVSKPADTESSRNEEEEVRRRLRRGLPRGRQRLIKDSGINFSPYGDDYWRNQDEAYMRDMWYAESGKGKWYGYCEGCQRDGRTWACHGWDLTVDVDRNSSARPREHRHRGACDDHTSRRVGHSLAHLRQCRRPMRRDSLDKLAEWWKSILAATATLLGCIACGGVAAQEKDSDSNKTGSGTFSGKGRRGTSRPLWLGTNKWAVEGRRVGKRRYRRTRLYGGFHALRLGDSEMWRRDWRPWRRDRRDTDHADLPTWRDCAQFDDWTTCAGDEHAAHRAYEHQGHPSTCRQYPRQLEKGGAGRYSDDDRRRRADNVRRRLVAYGTGRRVVALITAAVLAGLRIGEASHPGFGLRDPLLMQLKEAPLPDKHERLAYANPDQTGFRGGKSPGFHKDDRPKKARLQQEVQLKVESANVTGPAGLRTRLRATCADVLLAQETWVTEDKVPELREWARRQRWTSLWAPARPGSNGGRPSGGTAVLVRSHLGLREPDVGGSVWCQHRACAGIVEVPGYRPTVCISAYFQNGEGWGRENTALMAAICAGLEEQGTIAGRVRPTIIGADANMTPEEFARSGVGEEAGLRVVRPQTSRGTFRTRSSARCIDYYIMGGGMAEVVDDISTVEAAGITGHTPVLVTFQPRATAKKSLTARTPPKLPTERAFGPLPAPPCYAEASRKAEAAREAATRPDLGWDRQRRLDAAYAALANTMEEELSDITGTKLPVLGRRAENPHLVWRSVLHERPAEHRVSKAAYPKWAKGIMLELMAADRRREEQERRAARGSTGRSAKRTGGNTARSPSEHANRSREQDISRAISEVPHDIAHLHHTPSLSILTELARTLPGGPLGGDCGECGAEQRLTWRRAADQHVEALHREAKRAEDEERQVGIDKWREWLRKDIDQGGRNAHAYSKVPQQWKPATTRPDDWREEEYEEEEEEPGHQQLQISSAPWHLLEDKRNAMHQEWNGAQEDFIYDWTHWDNEVARSPGVSPDHSKKLPNIEGEAIKRAAMAFKASTSSTYDGFHVRHFGLVCDEAREAAAKLLDAVEACGLWPTQIALAITPMIPKPKGGFRVIGSMPALYRVWAKTRREAAVEWERKFQRGYYAASPGTGPLDVVWAQAAKQEAGAAKGEVTGMILEDLASFYEGISRDLLANEAAHLGFPLQVLRGSLGMYANPRLVALNGRVAKQIHPRRGVIAGCAFATTYVKVLMTRALDRAMAGMPEGVVLDAYIDDLALSATGTSKQVVEKLEKAHQILREAVQHELGCNFAHGKTAVVATCAATARRLKEVVGVQGRIFEAAPNLGIDAPAAKPRGTWSKNSLRKSRLVQATQRESRLRKLSTALGAKATRIYRTGAEKAGTYGAEIWGMADTETKKLRRLAAATVRPRGRGRSLTLALLLAGAPTATAEVLAVTQYHRVVWRGVTQREQSRMRGTSLGIVDSWFREAQPYSKELVEEAGYAQGGHGGGTRRRRQGAAAAWRKVRGPIAAAHLTLARMGWRFVDAFEVRDERGHSIPLTQTSPSLMKELLVDGVRRQMERWVGETWSKKDPAFKGRRVCVDVALRNMRSSRSGLNSKQIGAYRSATCGALMTMSRAAEEGYLVQDVCPLCGACGDTVHHRVYHCPKTRAAVEAAVPRWFLEEARGQNPSSRFWTTAILPHPCDLAPPPQKKASKRSGNTWGHSEKLKSRRPRRVA